MKMRLFAAAVTLCVFCVATACSSGGPGISCLRRADCPPELDCLNNRCVQLADGAAPAPDSGPPDASLAPDSGPIPDAASDPDAAPPPDSGPPGGQYGDACDEASDCASQLCVANRITGQNICTIECLTDSTCQPMHACVTVPAPGGGTISICVPSDAGTACPDGQGTSCVYGLCLVHPTQGSFSICSTPCSSARACPAGHSCSLVSTGPGQQQRLCTPVGTACSVQGISSQCLTRWCSTQAQVPTDGICTNNCRTAADCPSGWACGLDDATGGSVVDVCQPLASAGNPIACNHDAMDRNNCYSKTCAIVSGSRGYCTSFCMNVSFQPESARCPSGYRCVAVDLGGQTGYACEL